MYTERLFDSPPEGQASLLVDLDCSDTEPARMFVFGEVDALTVGQLQIAIVDVLRRQRPSWTPLGSGPWLAARPTPGRWTAR